MTPVQVWTSFCSLLQNLHPECTVKRVYKPTEEFEKLAESDKPEIWVQLSNYSIGAINTMATVIEDSYTFSLSLLWKLRSDGTTAELDSKLDSVQDYLTQLRQSYVDTNEFRMYFGIPSCDSVYNDEILVEKGVFLTNYSIPVTIYRDVNASD